MAPIGRPSEFPYWFVGDPEKIRRQSLSLGLHRLRAPGVAWVIRGRRKGAAVSIREIGQAVDPIAEFRFGGITLAALVEGNDPVSPRGGVYLVREDLGALLTGFPF